MILFRKIISKKRQESGHFQDKQLGVAECSISRSILRFGKREDANIKKYIGTPTGTYEKIGWNRMLHLNRL